MGQRGLWFSKDSQSGNKDTEHSEDNMLNNRRENYILKNENKEGKAINQHQSGQADVPTDKILSDEYNKHDEDNEIV